MLAIVASSETIGSQANQSSAKPGRQLVRHNLHIIGGCNDRSFVSLQSSQDIRPLGLLRRVQQIPPLGLKRIAAQLVVTGYTPHIRLHAVLLSKNALGAKCLVQDWTASEELHCGFAARLFKFVDSAKNAFSAV